jgi:hypothetical protein
MDIQDQSLIRKLIEFEGIDEYKEVIKKARNTKYSSLDLSIMEQAVFNDSFQRIRRYENDYFLGCATHPIIIDGQEMDIKFVVVSKKVEDSKVEDSIRRMRLPEDPKFLPNNEERTMYLEKFSNLVPNTEPEHLPNYLSDLFDEFNPQKWNDFLN